jgi:hypothetical protein
MIERADGGPLDELHAAIQSFSNGLADNDSDVGVVMNALVVWEEVSFDDDGTPQRATFYAATGDQATPNGSLGLSLNLLRTLEHDVIRCNHGSDE